MQTVIAWFTATMNKRTSLSIKFDIMDIYSIILKKLHSKSTDYANSITIMEEEIKEYSMSNNLFYLAKAMFRSKKLTQNLT